MTERSRFWDGTAVGDALAVTQTHLQNQFFRALLNGTGNRGVLRQWRNELLVSGTTSPLTIATGGAVVYGAFFDMDAATSISVPTPSSGFSRYDIIVAQRDWNAQTIRIARHSGTAAAVPAVPTPTQTAGSIYEIPLANIYITDDGTIGVTDAREFCEFTTDWPNDAVDTQHYAPGAVTPAKVPDRTRYQLKGSGQIEPDSANACTWTAGGSYDYWEFADAATNAGWVYFMGPTGLVGGQVDIYIWTVPDVNGAGGGAENAQWDYNTYSGSYGSTLANTNGTVNVDQQARVNTTVYADQLIAGFAISEGDILILQLSRDGAADSYNSAMRLLGIEMRWTADA